MAYLNATSKEKFIIPNIENDILLGNSIGAGYIDVDCSVHVNRSREIVGERFEDSTIFGCSLNIISYTTHKCENSCEKIFDSYQYKENNSQILTKMKTNADPIIADLHCVTISDDKIFPVDDTLENASSFGICDLFEQTSLNVRLNLSKCEIIWSELNICNIKADSWLIKIVVLYLIALDI